MAEEKNNVGSGTYMLGMSMIILAAVAVGIFIALMVINRDRLSIERAHDYPRDDVLEIEYEMEE